MNNISYSEKSVASNVSDSIVNAFWYWLQSYEHYLHLQGTVATFYS